MDKLKDNLRLFTSLLISSIMAGCLHYPARVSYGTRKNKSSVYAQQLLSSQLIRELSPPQLEALDQRGLYASRYPVRVYRISYRSRNFTPLSALVLLPKGTASYPVLCYHHGTLLPFPRRHLGAYEAPSFFGSPYRRAKNFFAVNIYGLPAASSGYLTVLPDYMGYGIQAGQEHPFMIGPELGQESLDALRAVYQWAQQEGLQLRSQLYLAGISEGAYAAMWTQRLLEAAPDFAGIQVEGAYYAGPFHMSSLLERLAFDSANIDKLFNWTLYSTWNYYLRDGTTRLRNLEQHFQPQQFRQLTDNLHSWQKADIWLGKVPNILAILLQKPRPKEKLFQPSFLEQIDNLDSDFWVLARLLNIHDGWQPKGPIYLYHNRQDPLIPVRNSQDTQNALNAAGGQVRLQVFERDDHTGGHAHYVRQSLREFSRSSNISIAGPYTCGSLPKSAAREC